MSEDLVFRLIFIVVLLLTYAFRIGQKRQGLSSRRIRGSSETIHTLVAWLWLIVMVLYPVGILKIGNLNLSLSFRCLGVVLAVLSMGLLYITHKSLGINFSPKLQLRDNHRLIKEGPYRLIRHPMYTAELFGFLAAFLISANIIVAAVNILAMIVILIRIPMEEKMMINRFGQEYFEYMRGTGRLLPKIIRH